MAIADRSGLPVAICATSASPHEVTLVEQTLDSKFTVDYPARLIGDKAYDSNQLNAWLATQYGVKMIAPHLSNRKLKTQDGRELRRYKRRWRVGLDDGLMNFAGMVTERWEWLGRTGCLDLVSVNL